ncbi:hypothetical protein [Ureibacillus manganicus]|uniref:hypothetical protein n=1 Tax=Ureibacillus manganicus TaxID=1266064 RepID=UPI00068CA54B|nr:hypothetical protein [Ureibacillus manganicus]
MGAFFKKVAKSIWEEESIPSLEGYSMTMRLLVGSLLGSMAVILQSTGIFTGIGFMFSMMSTGPVVLASLLSLRIGLMTYIITCFILALLQPSELLVFLCTTGLLGLSLGIGLKVLKRGLFIVSFGALCLTMGISILLYVLQFPILGPSVTSQFSIIIILIVVIFSLLYSWLWKIISVSIFKALYKVFFKRLSDRR